MLDKNGNVVDGAIDFYAISGFPGLYFYSEVVSIEDDGTYVFDLDHTCLIKPMLQDGNSGFMSMSAKGREELLFADKIVAPVETVTRFNSMNAQLYENSKKNIHKSPLILASKGR